MKMISLFDKTGHMSLPWAEAGYQCLIVDIQHPEGIHPHPEFRNVWTQGADLTDWKPSREWATDVEFVAAFPPCDHLSVSGARWFKGKGLRKLSQAIELFAVAAEWCEFFGAAYCIENPVSTISSYWRKPDHIFQPWQYCGLCPVDVYNKKTCLWTGSGFVMPAPLHPDDVTPDDRIHRAPPRTAARQFSQCHADGIRHGRLCCQQAPGGGGMSIPVGMSTYYKRIALWGYTQDEAGTCPRGMPVWMYRIEQSEARSVRDMLAEGAATARDTGYSLADHAREWGVNPSTLQHWSDKWGIRWPLGASALQREAARQNAMHINQRRASA